MSRRREYGVLLALAAMLWTACGRGESGAAAQDRAAATSTPGATAPSTAQPAPSPAGSQPDAQKTAVDPDAAYDKGAALAVARRFADARQAFADAARLAPLDGSLSAAVAMFDDLAANRISEDVVQRLFQAGEDANAERWAEAHADVDDTIRLAPRYAPAHGLRGTLYLQQGKREEALEAFGEAITLDPAFADGYHNRGATHAALEQYDAAVADYTRAIALRPDFWDAYMNRGSAHTQRGLARLSKPDLLAAMADHTKAHELNPGAAEPLYLRGELYAVAEQWNEATADFTAAIARDPARAGAYYDRGVAHQNQGDDDRAVADYTKAIALDPADPRPLINRGVLYAKQKDYERAIADADKAASVAPAMANPHYNKGEALEHMGRPTEAAAEYRIVLQKDSADDSALARQARQRLRAIEKSPED